jgi:hypothetical protein
MTNRRALVFSRTRRDESSNAVLVSRPRSQQGKGAGRGNEAVTKLGDRTTGGADHFGEDGISICNAGL